MATKEVKTDLYFYWTVGGRKTHGLSSCPYMGSGMYGMGEAAGPAQLAVMVDCKTCQKRMVIRDGQVLTPGRD